MQLLVAVTQCLGCKALENLFHFPKSNAVNSLKLPISLCRIMPARMM